jgi:hypothetical protein
MRLFDDKIVDLLRPEIRAEPIYYVGLGAFDFQFGFGKLVRVQNLLRVDFNLRGVEYTWENGPSAIPAWLLIDQVPSDVSLETPASLTMKLVSGDWVRFHTEECPYECQIFEWSAPNKDAIVVEIY